MAYLYSQVDTSISSWFRNDPTAQTLRAITLETGAIRGLSDLTINFDYPLTAIAGRNGSGKSTLLAMAACAFHNQPSGFNPLNRKNPYYTFSDFFIQSAEEVPLDGVTIHYLIHYNNWRKTPEIPTGVGLAFQSRHKRKGGRWNDYATRVHRNVVFLGIDRVVPHSERTVFKSYRSRFRESRIEGWEKNVREAVGRILGRNYGDLKYKTHRKYRLPVVEREQHRYTGFNMGAGENALFKLFATIYGCPEPLLLVIDEIELGLHEEAQELLIRELKSICKRRKLQVICTTHSSRVLGSLPPEGRVFLERFDKKVIVSSNISVEYATGLMSGKSNPELDILVEDEVAADIVRGCVDMATRKRIRLVPVGSHANVVRHLAMRKIEGVDTCFAILDGDQRNHSATHLSNFQKALESGSDSSSEAWANSRLSFLPGNDWPERWLVSKMREAAFCVLDQDWGLTPHERVEIMNKALQAPKHAEFHAIAQSVGFPEQVVRNRVIGCALASSPTERQAIETNILKALDL